MNRTTKIPGAPLLYIVGGDDPDRVIHGRGGIGYSGSTDVAKLLGRTQPYHGLRATPDLLRRPRLPDLSRYACILNLIAEPECNRRSLEVVGKLLRDAPTRVVNRPEAVLKSSRDQVAALLDGIAGLLVPRTARLPADDPDGAVGAIEGAGLRFPLIVRQVGTHGGKIVGPFAGTAQLRACLPPKTELIATEFVDFRSGDGLYRKYRVFFFGRTRVLRHMLVSDHWNVHAKDRTRFMAGRPDVVADEAALFTRAEPLPTDVRHVLDEVRARMSLDFFGMDFARLPDGRVVLFEANAAMSFFPLAADPQFAYLGRSLRPAQKALRELLGLPASPVRPSPMRINLGR